MPEHVLPGRPGTLSPAEEAKLTELWHLVLQFSGIASDDPGTPNGASSRSQTLSQVTSESSALTEEEIKRSLRFLNNEVQHESKNVSSTTGPIGLPTTLSVSENTEEMKNNKPGSAFVFNAVLADIKPAEIHEAFWNVVKHDHPDALLLGFLRARKWDVNAAFVMTVSALHWRLGTSKVDSDIMFNGDGGMQKWAQSSGPQAKVGEDFMSQLRMGKSFLHGRDKQDRPLCYVRARLHKPGLECEEAIERFMVYTIEMTRMFLQSPVDTATVIFDMTGSGIANIDYKLVKFMINCFVKNYPESLGLVLVHNAPWVFNAIWKIIKTWLDPVVASKIHFTNNVKDIEVFIDKRNIIKELGGPLDWEYTYPEPIEGENAVMENIKERWKLQKERADMARDYEVLVLQWITSRLNEPMDKSTTLTPSQEADTFRRRRDEIASKLRKNYWDLDPYIRARSMYDRLGELRADADPLSWSPCLSR